MDDWCNGLIRGSHERSRHHVHTKTYPHLPPPPVSHVISTLMSKQAPACPALPARSASETSRIRRGSGSSGGAAEEKGT